MPVVAVSPGSVVAFSSPAVVLWVGSICIAVVRGFMVRWQMVISWPVFLSMMLSVRSLPVW